MGQTAGFAAGSWIVRQSPRARYDNGHSKGTSGSVPRRSCYFEWHEWRMTHHLCYNVGEHNEKGGK